MPMLSLIKSPLRGPTHEAQTLLQHHSDEEQVQESKQPGRTETNASVLPLEGNDEALHESPAFRHHAEATSNELFYDLFVVANLTTFTNNHEINSIHSLSSYIGFFCVLWFTWYQVSLYDVRFAMDSVFDRVCKALQFGVMVGFAVIGPAYDPGWTGYRQSNFRAMSLLLMVSRLVLCVQYGSTLWFTKDYRKTKLPLLLVITSTFIAAVLYAAIVPAFPATLDRGQTSHTYIAFYVIAVCETIVTTLVACVLRVISFKGTHLVQRMSLLTLIILGEGVIGLTKSIATIVANLYLWTPDTIGQVVSSVLIIYFLYMLYFDRCETEQHFGTIRQQIWSFLHFPLHIAFVLALEGVNQNIVWHQGFDSARDLDNQVVTLVDDYQNNATYTAEEFIGDLNSTAQYIFDYVPSGVEYGEAYTEVQEALESLEENLGSNDTTAMDAVTTAASNYEFALFNTILESLRIEAPETDGTKPETPEDQLDALSSVFDLIYVYLFVAAGIAVIIMEVLGLISKPPKTITAWLRTAVNVAIGVGLCLLSIMDTTNTGVNFLLSSWILPTLCLSLLLALVVVHLRKLRR